MKKILVLLLCLELCGCAASSKFINTLKQNPNLTIAETEQKLGEYRKVIYTPRKNITVFEYPDYNIYLFFKDNRLYDYSIDDTNEQMKIKYKLSLISKEEYQNFLLISLAILNSSSKETSSDWPKSYNIYDNNHNKIGTIQER